LGLGGGCGGGRFAVAGVGVGVGEVRFVPPGDVGMRGAVGAERGRGCMAEGVAGMWAPNVGTFSPGQVDPTGSESNANKVLIRGGDSSVNLASQGHCAGVFIGTRVPSILS
jgi:hypothetical protein